LEKLVTLGFHIALDDFGTGYSSINYIKDLPIHKIKVDRSFLAKITNEKYHAMLKTIVQLAKDFGFDVTMEGVETEEQLELIKPLNPYEIQGYLFAKPMPLNQVLERIRQKREHKVEV
jgi:EAL domain-containing protein (putative c-di-GMP-specific phosphodiesterase class I)